jgi:transposase
MEAYSQDLRDRVLSACDEGVDTRGEIAERFAVSTAFIRRVLQRRRETGSTRAKPRSGGPEPSLDAAALARVRGLVAECPDATLAELRGRLSGAGGPSVSVATMCRALRGLNLVRKKSRRTRASVTRRG